MDIIKNSVFGLVLSMSLLQAFEVAQIPAKNPIEIHSDKGLVCDHAGNTCTAEGKVEMQRGAQRLTCEKLIAHFTKDGDGKMSIVAVEAKGHVHIFSLDNKNEATANYAHYEEATKRVLLRGNPVVKANDSILYGTQDLYYFQNDGYALAPQRATLLSQDKLLQADHLKAYFHTKDTAPKRSDGKGVTLDRIEGQGDVIVSSASEIARGDMGFYNADTKIAEILHNVTITRCDGELQGAKAEVNLMTGKSRIIDSSKGRVKVLLVPKHAKNKDSV